MKKLLSIAILIPIMIGCAGNSNLNLDIDKQQGACNTGRIVLNLARRYAPDYVPQIERVRDSTWDAVTHDRIALGAAIGDVIAVVQAITHDKTVDEYARIAADATTLLMGAVNLNWNTPEKYAEAKNILIAFLACMKGET